MAIPAFVHSLFFNPLGSLIMRVK